jgi:putative lipoic acid-binding regulatory protein
MPLRLIQLKLVIDETMKFPTNYMFKFIVPKDELPNILGKLDGFKIREHNSSGGKYISVTAQKVFNTSDEIINVYKSVSSIKGLIAL